MTGGSRKLSTLDATLLVMGGIIGVGIFFTPQIAAERTLAPLPFLGTWVFGGLIALCAAFTFAEFGATFPRTGGWFVYLREAFGPFPAFLFAWIVLFVVSTGAVAAVATVCANMLHIALPALVGEKGSASHRAAAVLLILSVTGVALCGVKRAALAQDLVMGLKLLALLALILAGLVFATPAATGASAAAPASSRSSRSSSPTAAGRWSATSRPRSSARSAPCRARSWPESGA